MTTDCSAVNFEVVGGGGTMPTATATATTSATNTPTVTPTPTTTVGTTGKVQITDILYDSPVPSETSGEYVELKSFDSDPIQLQSWRIDDEAGTFHTFGSFVLQPGATVRVHKLHRGELDDGPLQRRLPGSLEQFGRHRVALRWLVDTGGQLQLLRGKD